jgi:2-hydroxycyclohexanecarboxyl-CoA dehydrogenase
MSQYEGEGARSALVVGSTGAIGSAICRALLDEGLRVLAGYRDEAKAEKTLASLPANAECLMMPFDVGSPETVATSFGRLGQVTDRLDVLVNAAGDHHLARFEDTTPEIWRYLLEVNLLGPMALCWHALPWMKASQGVIINVTSEAATAGYPREAAYSAAKGGLTTFTKSLALEVARHGIRVNCVAPGPIDTELFHDPRNLDEAGARANAAGIRERVPLRRFGRPEEVAAAVAFLVGVGGDYMTGQTIHVGGGITM